MWALISTLTLARREIIHKSDRYEIITGGGGRQAERHSKRKADKDKRTNIIRKTD